MLSQYEKRSKIKFLLQNSILASAPKSGRTWLRMIFAKILLENRYDTKHFEFIFACHYLPDRVIKEFSKDLKIVLLIRDPRDTAVSLYHEYMKSKRINKQMSIDEFVTSSKGVPYFVDYLNKWMDSFCDFEKEILIMTYEDLKMNTFDEVKRCLKYLQYDIGDYEIDKAIKYSSFSNMKKIEEGVGNNLLKHYKGKFGRAKLESINDYRVRKGLIGGYADELEEQTIDKINKQCQKLQDHPFLIPYKRNE